MLPSRHRVLGSIGETGKRPVCGNRAGLSVLRTVSAIVSISLGPSLTVLGVARDDLERAHHRVRLVLEDVAVPHVFAREAVELGAGPDGFTGVDPDGVFRTAFVGPRFVSSVLPATDDLEVDEVQVDRMGVVPLVLELPDLGRPDCRW